VGTSGTATVRVAEATLLGGHRFYDNEEVVIAFREWLLMQDADFYRD
jgi:hypothetical protein